MNKEVLDILGAPQEGYEWQEFPMGAMFRSGDVAIDKVGDKWNLGHSDHEQVGRGVVYGTGKFYRQVKKAEEPEIEVIWKSGRPGGWAERVVLSDGTLAMAMDLKESESPHREQVKELAQAYASLHAAKKAETARADKAEVKLREIKEQANSSVPGAPSALRRAGYFATAELIELCRGIEL